MKKFLLSMEDWIDSIIPRGGPVSIQTYMPYGNSKTVFARGRIRYGHALRSSRHDSGLKNLITSLRRFIARDARFQEVDLSVDGRHYSVKTDEEGYFSKKLNVGQIDIIAISCMNASVEVPVYIPSGKLGIITDMDDTVLQSRVTNPIRLIINTFLRNEYTRLPFKGIKEFFDVLDGSVFYVSSSPWNLHDMLVRFLEINDLPIGPLFLTDMGLSKDTFITPSHRSHKVHVIEHLLQVYDFPFILVGDSTQHDPDIYREIAMKHKDRIAAVYIRDESMEGVHIVSLGHADMVFSADSHGMMDHAKSLI